MKMKTTQNYSNQVSIHVLDYLDIEIALKESSLQIPLGLLFETALRKNKKRAFLFVSKILGKHLAVDPKIPLLGGLMLAYQYGKKEPDDAIRLLKQQADMNEQDFEKLMRKKVNVPEKTLFIGFAETATGLGHSMFACCQGEISYIHTTREMITSESPSFTFEEVHSHAVGHQCFGPKEDYFRDFKEIVLVDDEITTGHTALNLIEALYRKSHVTNYKVVSLLDWRSSEEMEEARMLEKKLHIQIQFISLIQGNMQVHLLKQIPEEIMQPAPLLEEDHLTSAGSKQPFSTIRLYIEPLMLKKTKGGDEKERSLEYMKANGRFGITADEDLRNREKLLKAGEKLARLRQYKKCLVIGTEEFIYMPCFLATCMGKGVKYQSSTRSPIISGMYSDYPIKNVLAYRRPEDKQVINYLYNILPDTWEEVFWIMERDVEDAFKQMITEALIKRGIKKVTFVTCDGHKTDEREETDQ